MMMMKCYEITARFRDSVDLYGVCAAVWLLSVSPCLPICLSIWMFIRLSLSVSIKAFFSFVLTAPSCRIGFFPPTNNDLICNITARLQEGRYLQQQQQQQQKLTAAVNEANIPTDFLRRYFGLKLWSTSSWSTRWVNNCILSLASCTRSRQIHVGGWNDTNVRGISEDKWPPL